jgi:hypothetical protein
MKVTDENLKVARAVRDADLESVSFSKCTCHCADDMREHDLAALIAAIPDPAPHGCYCEIESTVSGEPDVCVFDNGDVEDCIFAIGLQREGKGKLQCEYWRPIKPTETQK